MVFGEALIKAHAFETTIVKYPRIMITKDIVQDARRSEKAKEFDEFIIPSEDGPSYLHVLWQIEMIFGIYRDNASHKGSENFIKWYSEIGATIEKKFSKSVDTPKHFEKVKWFADYWNRTVDPLSSKFVLHINRPGLPYYFPTPPDNRVRLDG